MALSCGSKVLKFFIFLTNAIVCIASVTFLVMAIRVLASEDVRKFPKLPDVTADHSGLLMLSVFASLSALISFMGCYGAVNEQRGMLLAYAVILFFFIALLVVAQVLVASSYNRIEKIVENSLTESYRNQTKNETTIEEFKQTEKFYECCGPSESLKKAWIEAGGCKNGTDDWESQPPCSKRIVNTLGAGVIVILLVLLFAALTAMGGACCLRSAIIDRGSYIEFS